MMDCGQVVLYQTEDWRQRMEVRLKGEPVWLTQRFMAELYGIGVNTVNQYIKSDYAHGELSPTATIRQYRIVQQEGKRQKCGTRCTGRYKQPRCGKRKWS